MTAYNNRRFESAYMPDTPGKGMLLDMKRTLDNNNREK